MKYLIPLMFLVGCAGSAVSSHELDTRKIQLEKVTKSAVENGKAMEDDMKTADPTAKIVVNEVVLLKNEFMALVSFGISTGGNHMADTYFVLNCAEECFPISFGVLRDPTFKMPQPKSDQNTIQ